MKNQEVESPWTEWPDTKPTKDGGIRITGKYVHPMLPGRAMGLAFVLGTIIVIALLSWYDAPGPAIWGVVGFLVVWYAGLKAAVYKLLGKSVDVTVYPDKIKVWDGTRYRLYDRNVRIEFRHETHEKAAEEISRAIKKGSNTFRVFQEAVQVVMQYGEKRVPIAELRVKDLKLAQALVIRLQNVCATLDQAMRRMSEGQIKPAQAQADTPTATPPAGDFGPAPDIR